MVENTSSQGKIITFMIILSLIAIGLFSYLLYLHYAETESFCDISSGLSCDIVNKSEYSEFPPGSGIPVSLMGILTFILVIILLMLIKNNKAIKIGSRNLDKKSFSKFLFYLMILSLLFSLYLIYAELFLILSVCLLCVVGDIIIVIMLFLSYKLKRISNV